MDLWKIHLSRCLQFQLLPFLGRFLPVLGSVAHLCMRRTSPIRLLRCRFLGRSPSSACGGHHRFACRGFQFLGWSPASSWVGRPHTLSFVSDPSRISIVPAATPSCGAGVALSAAILGQASTGQRILHGSLQGGYHFSGLFIPRYTARVRLTVRSRPHLGNRALPHGLPWD